MSIAIPSQVDGLTRVAERVGGRRSHHPEPDSRRGPSNEIKGVTMRSGKLRGVSLTLGLLCALAFVSGDSTPARAGDFHAIPRLVEGVDVNTGGPMYAPPIPYGHYAGKNIHGRLGAKARGLVGGLHGGGGGGGSGCSACGGAGCGLCGGIGKGGLLRGHGHGAGLCNGADGCGLGQGGLGHGGHGHGGFASGNGCSTCGLNHGGGVVASAQFPVPVAMPSSQSPCSDPGCGLFGKGSHHHRKGCGLCGGRGCGSCGVSGSGCGACGGKGCGSCGGIGRGGACGACGGKGCGLCGGLGHGGGLCKNCGGAGCSVCSKAKGLVSHLLGHDKIKWFVGPGGPIPITPGYTPYINVTRSPRDFLAFPPFTP